MSGLRSPRLVFLMPAAPTWETPRRDCRNRSLTRSDTPLLSETSYGNQKAVIELYCYDYGRKGE